MKKFIYVFSEADKDKLMKAGFELLMSDKSGRFFVFRNTDDIVISSSFISFVLSDTLIF